MKSELRFFVLLGSLLLFSCRENSSKVDVEEIDFPSLMESAPVDFPLSKLISRIEFVPLETSESVLLSGIWKINRNGNRIVVSDKMGIWMFDGQGRFIRNILWQGNGPGEVPMPGTIPFHINSEGTVSFYTDRFIQIDSTGHRIYESPLLQEELVQEPYSQVFGTDTRCWFMMNTYATCDVVSTDTEWFRTGNKPDSLFSNKTRLKTIDFNAAVPKYYCHYAWKENITNDYLFFVDCETGDWGRLYKDGRREVTKHINFGEDEDLCWVVYIRDFGDYLNLRARSVSEGFRDVLYEKATGKFTSVRSIYDDLSHSGSYNFFHTTSDGCLAIPEEFGTFLQRVENSGDSKLKDMVKDFPEDTNLVLVFFTLKNIE